MNKNKIKLKFRYFLDNEKTPKKIFENKKYFKIFIIHRNIFINEYKNKYSIFSIDEYKK